MATAKADENGYVTDAICDYYQERAKYSKIGLIITEHSYIHPQGKAHPGQTTIASDDALPFLQRLTDCIHQEDVKVFAQLSHAGSAALSKITGQPPVGPSPIYHPKQQEELPAEMTLQQIRQVTEWFAQAALRAKQAGFDGVELHSAHGYLLNQFFSPLANHRTDEYGPQSVENRIRFHREVIQAVRQAVGEDFPILDKPKFARPKKSHHRTVYAQFSCQAALRLSDKQMMNSLRSLDISVDIFGKFVRLVIIV